MARKKKRLKLLATRVRLDRQGYDRHGRYYGVGAPVYRVEADNNWEFTEVRASDAKSARAKALPEIERKISIAQANAERGRRQYGY
jgi:hypothetical protein